ncbi:MAG: flavodoxin-dependent (E)-4-hydroxy-3-methylbut-2-enyl-diphosphate synthase [Chloroflexota bacterium]
MERRQSKLLHVGPVPIGAGSPVVVQSMTNTDTRDAQATLRQIGELADVGCEIARVAVPDNTAAAALPEIVAHSPLPVIADIHFDYRLALAALAAGVHGLRLNPGNIRKPEQVRAVVTVARERAVPIRIGVNAGSLPALRAMAHPGPAEAAAAMVDACLEQVHFLENLDFDLIKISLKASDVPTTIEAYRRMADLVPYPLHLGITEAGTPRVGTIRSAVGLGTLLYLGIGDTLRVSLTGDPCEEVRVAYEILKSLGLREQGPTLISCPTCGRTQIDLLGLANAVEDYLATVKVPLKVAVMGCVVNGPGEASDADVGVAGGKGKGVIFRHGEIVRTVREEEILPALLKEIDDLVHQKSAVDRGT